MITNESTCKRSSAKTSIVVLSQCRTQARYSMISHHITGQMAEAQAARVLREQ